MRAVFSKVMWIGRTTGGTLFHEDVCIETNKRGPAGFLNAEAVCLQADRSLPTVAELQTFRLREGQDLAAQSNLRNAASAATACAAGNDGSYANCGTIAELEANGYQRDSNVTLMITTASATRWVAQAHQDNGGSAYEFDTETGNMTPIPRF